MEGRFQSARADLDKFIRTVQGAAATLGDEAYLLEIRPGLIQITAPTPRAEFYARQTLQQLAGDAGPVDIPAVKITDWPDIEKRMVMYDVGRNNTVNVEYWKHWIDELSRLKINQIMFYMEDDYAYKKYPFMGRAGTFTAEKIAELTAYARERHIELIPNLEAFAHAERILAYPEFQELRLGNNWSAFSPCVERTYSVLGDLFSELVPQFPLTQMFHIGADEVWGLADDPRCASIVKQHGQPYLYAQHVSRLKTMLAGMGRKTAIWGDEILNHPETAALIDKDVTIFDWHYEEDREFPSLKQFQDWGFKEIYASPAVFGHWDVYTQLPVSFRNIRGFTQAAREHGVKGVCITIWAMQSGGNAENYLYGLAYGAQVMWNGGQSSAKRFNRDFARAWFGIKDARAAAHVDRAFWFPWRVSGSSLAGEMDISGFWQNLFETSSVFFRPFQELSRDLGQGNLEVRIRDSKRLLLQVKLARPSLEWLSARAKRNHFSLKALDTVMKVYEHVARKTLATDLAAYTYRRDYHQRAPDRPALLKTLREGIARLEEVRSGFAAIHDSYAQLIAMSNHDPGDLPEIQKLQKNLDEYLQLWRRAEAALSAGQRVPTPAELGLAAK